MQMELIIGLLVFALFIVTAIILFISIRKKIARDAKKKASVNLDTLNPVGQVKLNIPYISKNMLQFYQIYSSVLPSAYIAFPLVKIGNIVKPTNNKVLYNMTKDKCVDMVVFLKKNMQPVMIVDIIDPTIVTSYMYEMDKDVKLVAKGLNLPIVSVTLGDEYDKGALLEGFLNALDPVSLAELKKAKAN